MTPENEAPVGDYSAIQRKVRRARLRKDRMKSWAKWAGVLAGVLLYLFVIGRAIFRPDHPHPSSGLTGMALGLIPILALMAAGVGAAAAAVFDLLRPIWLAVTNSRRFEQEYGTGTSPSPDAPARQSPSTVGTPDPSIRPSSHPPS